MVGNKIMKYFALFIVPLFRFHWGWRERFAENQISDARIIRTISGEKYIFEMRYRIDVIVRQWTRSAPQYLNTFLSHKIVIFCFR